MPATLELLYSNLNLEECACPKWDTVADLAPMRIAALMVGGVGSSSLVFGNFVIPQ